MNTLGYIRVHSIPYIPNLSCLSLTFIESKVLTRCSTRVEAVQKVQEDVFLQRESGHHQSILAGSGLDGYR